MVEIQPVRYGDSVAVRFAVQHLIENEIRRSLLAGLPIILHIQAVLTDSRKTPIRKLESLLKITYDVWEESFGLRMNDGPQQVLSSLTELRQHLQRIELPERIPRTELSPKKTYRWSIETVAVILTRRQNEELKWWMVGGNPVEEDLPSQDRTTGFRLNLNQLIQVFLKKDESRQEYRQTAISAPFRITPTP